MAIEIDLRSVQRFWYRPGGWLKFVVKAEFDTEPILEDLVELTEEIDYRLRTEEECPSTVGGWVPTPSGWAGTVRQARSLDDALAWLERFCAIYRASATGKIIGGPRTVINWPHDPAPQLSAFVAYRTSDLRDIPVDDRARAWAVEDKITQHLAAQTTAWAYTRRAEHYLERYGDRFRITGEEAASALAEAIWRSTHAQFAALRADPFYRRAAGFWSHGEAIYQIADAQTGWADRVAAIRDTLTWTPPHTDLAFLRYNGGGRTNWDHPEPPWPHVKESYVRYNRPLLTSFVPDAHGLQLLTTAHLERAHDLSDWKITDLPGGRHLVEAPDLEPWYANPEPDPNTLARARRNFGDMILTREAVRDHLPWRPGDNWHNMVRGMLRRDSVTLDPDDS